MEMKECKHLTLSDRKVSPSETPEIPAKKGPPRGPIWYLGAAQRPAFSVTGMYIYPGVRRLLYAVTRFASTLGAEARSDALWHSQLPATAGAGPFMPYLCLGQEGVRLIPEDGQHPGHSSTAGLSSLGTEGLILGPVGAQVLVGGLVVRPHQGLDPDNALGVVARWPVEAEGVASAGGLRD